jgi:hypothetical protein
VDEIFFKKGGLLPEILFLVSPFRMQHLKRKSAIWVNYGWNFPLDYPFTLDYSFMGYGGMSA